MCIGDTDRVMNTTTHPCAPLQAVPLLSRSIYFPLHSASFENPASGLVSFLCSLPATDVTLFYILYVLHRTYRNYTKRSFLLPPTVVILMTQISSATEKSIITSLTQHVPLSPFPTQHLLFNLHKPPFLTNNDFYFTHSPSHPFKGSHFTCTNSTSKGHRFTRSISHPHKGGHFRFLPIVHQESPPKQPKFISFTPRIILLRQPPSWNSIALPTQTLPQRKHYHSITITSRWNQNTAVRLTNTQGNEALYSELILCCVLYIPSKHH